MQSHTAHIADFVTGLLKPNRNDVDKRWWGVLLMEFELDIKFIYWMLIDRLVVMI